MYLHPEAYRILTDERINGFRREAAAEQQARRAAASGERAGSFTADTVRLLRAVVRALIPSARARTAV